MDRVLISPMAMGFLPIVMLHLVIFGYLCTRKDKSVQAQLFNGWLTCLMLLMVSQFISHIMYAPWGGYVNWIGSIGFAWAGLALALQFAYRFPRVVYAREARGVLIVCTVIAMGLLILMRVESLHSPRQPVYSFTQFWYVIGLGDRYFVSPYVFAVLYLLGQFWLLGVWARKTVHFSALSVPASGLARDSRWRQLKALRRPQGREAKSARAFFLLMVARLLSVLALILEPAGVLPPGSFAILYLPTVLIIVLTYINNSTEPSTFMAKLVGISLITLLVTLGLVNAIVLDGYRDVYDQARQAELAHIETLLEADRETSGDQVLEQIPAQTLYIAARPADGGLFSSTYDVLFSRVRGLRAQTLEQQDAHLRAELEDPFINHVAVLIENPWLSPKQVYLGPGSEFDRLTIPTGVMTYRGVHARPEQQYIRYALASQHGHTLYEVGYSYLGYRRMLHRKAMPLVYMTIATTLMILLVFPRFFQVSLVRPLQDLLDGVTRVNSGDLYVAVPVRVEDEIGSLTHAFNDMVRSLQTLHADSRREIAERQRVEAEMRASNVKLERRVVDQTRELSALYQVSAVASRALSLDRLLDESLAQVLVALRGDGGLIYLLDKDEMPPLRLAAQRGIPPDVLAQVDPWLATVVKQREPLLISDMVADPRARASIGQAKPLTFLMAPLQTGGRVLGVLGLARRPEQGFNQREMTLLASIADQVGAAVESDRLRQLAQQATVLEERQRLARDLHDSVTQFLYGLVTLTEAGQAQLEVEAWSAIDGTLSHIGKAARQALKEMRLFIHQLRPPVLEQEGLAVALHQRLAAVEGRADVQARLLADETIRLPLPVEVALYQIAQEALNNALKHADAASVTVHLGREGEQVVLEIRDDGRGFDLQEIDSDGMGLANMRERAEQGGGVLRVVSLPGGGTRIKMTVDDQE